MQNAGDEIFDGVEIAAYRDDGGIVEGAPAVEHLREERFELMRDLFDRRQIDGPRSAFQAVRTAKDIRQVDLTLPRMIEGNTDRMQMLAVLHVEGSQQLLADIRHCTLVLTSAAPAYTR